MRRILLIMGGLIFARSSSMAQQSHSPVTYVLVHGAWGGSWDWKIVDSMLTRLGNVVYRPALTGLGERVHLASTSIGLATHIDDVVNTILWENLHDVVLLGHSYGGVVITGVADRIPERIRQLIYLDAILPDSGETVLGIMPPELTELIRANTRDGTVVPPWEPADKPLPKDVPHPLRTLTDTLRLVNPGRLKVPATYILTVEPSEPKDPFQPFADRARARGWPVRVMTADHVPERSNPEALVRLLLQVVH
jgi:pimeloyl-ACP methyl ester carboxylesterase